MSRFGHQSRQMSSGRPGVSWRDARAQQSKREKQVLESHDTEKTGRISEFGQSDSVQLLLSQRATWSDTEERTTGRPRQRLDGVWRMTACLQRTEDSSLRRIISNDRLGIIFCLPRYLPAGLWACADCSAAPTLNREGQKLQGQLRPLPEFSLLSLPFSLSLLVSWLPPSFHRSIIELLDSKRGSRAYSVLRTPYSVQSTLRKHTRISAEEWLPLPICSRITPCTVLRTESSGSAGWQPCPPSSCRYSPSSIRGSLVSPHCPAIELVLIV